MSSNAEAALPVSATDPIRVMVVDDSAVIRGLLIRLLEEDPAIAVVASVSNGQMAISSLRRTRIDVAILDIEMPVMDGLTALPLMLAAAPDIKIIVASTLTKRNAQVSLKCLSTGATDYIAKPTSSEISAANEFKRELVAKVRAVGRGRRRRASEPAHDDRLARPVARIAPPPIVLRPVSSRPPQVIAIGSSTGGPQALMSSLGKLPASVRLPILITQHMPAAFTSILAEHLERCCHRPSAEARDGEVIQPGRIYVAPGDFHMTVVADGRTPVIRLNKEPPENFCRPAIDPMFRSLAQAFGSNVLGVILTGMGSDGAKGAAAVTAAGGTIIAQDEATSVIWGMPGAAAAAGVCSAILPLAEIPAYIARLSGQRIA